MPEVTLADCDREPIHIPGAVQPHGVLLALRAGFQAHVPKPVDPEELITVLETLTARQLTKP